MSTKYVNASEKLEIKCNKNHVYKTKWDVFNRGCRCNTCSTKIAASKQKYSIDFIKKEIEKYNYKLLSTYYKDALSKLKIQCDKGHIYTAAWHSFQSGIRCYVCFGTPKKTIEEVRNFAKNIGYVLLSKKYINAAEKLKFKCSDGHEFEVSWNNFGTINGSRCPICWYIKNRGVNHHNWKGGKSVEPYCEIFSNLEFKEIIKYRDGYKCLNPCCSKKSGRLAIHHIDYNKKNCEQDNLITVCTSCNAVANNNREWHKSWYQAIMYKRYNFIYK